ncbi:MAG: hypothetical protein NC305_07730 [Lachnospiraceae bacterium]|nr:hypothetical protein [Butyrivibrio sp.]MCM1343099.1 hypothetical protein [Muribaculaceae bacterium]MCM1410420.1 hypothetical protein [Lachnospiraceae bacterium]
MTKLVLNGNLLPLSALMTGLDSFFSADDSFILSNVKIINRWEEDKGTRVKTDQVEAITYTVVSTEYHSVFDIKVTDATHPIISPEKLEAAEEDVFVTLNLPEIMVKPYDLLGKKLKVSIQAPSSAITLIS